MHLSDTDRMMLRAYAKHLANHAIQVVYYVTVDIRFGNLD